MSNTDQASFQKSAIQQSITQPPVIQQTKNWVEQVVIGLNLCPFAAQPFKNNTIVYKVFEGNSIEQHLHDLADSFKALDENTTLETALLIYPDAYQKFDDYLELLDYANQLLEDLQYSGTYQLASFHPNYCFEGCTEDDASNYSNRSPYPMLHLIREADLEKALTSYPGIEQVPENNIKKLREIGYEEMQLILKKITT